MPKLRSFQGIHYNPDLVDLSTVICPPYDVITAQQVDDFYNKSQYNAVRLVLGKQYPKDTKDNNRYTRARDFFKQWFDKGILVHDEKPSLYYHEHTFSFGYLPDVYI